MEEAHAATMLISLVGKSAEQTMRIAGKSTETLAKFAAFLLSLWKKSSLKGQVKIAKLLESGVPLSAIAMNGQNYQRLQEMARANGIAYHAVYRQDIDSYLVTLKTDDLQRVKTVFDFYNMTPEAIGKEYFRFAIDLERCGEFQKRAAEQNLVYVTEMEAKTPIEYLKEGEMAKEDYAAIVEKNKDHSAEASAIHSFFWPKLESQENLEIVTIDSENYEKFKTQNRNGIAYAAVVRSDGRIDLAYAAENRKRITELTGADQPVILVDQHTLNSRMEQAKQSQPSNVFIVEGLDREKVNKIYKEMGIEQLPTFEKMTMTEASYENLQQQMEQIRENSDTAKELPVQQENFDFENRKQQVVKANGCIDFETWANASDSGKAVPENLNLCLKTDQTVLEELQKENRAENLNEAKAVRQLKQEKVRDIGVKLSKVKGKELTPVK